MAEACIWFWDILFTSMSIRYLLLLDILYAMLFITLYNIQCLRRYFIFHIYCSPISFWVKSAKITIMQPTQLSQHKLKPICNLSTCKLMSNLVESVGLGPCKICCYSAKLNHYLNTTCILLWWDIKLWLWKHKIHRWHSSHVNFIASIMHNCIVLNFFKFH